MKEKKEERFRAGQSMVEYLILLAIVIAVLIVFLRPAGFFQAMYNKVIRKQGDDMMNAAVTFFK